MARTFRNTPDPHYAKKAFSGEVSSSSDSFEIIIAEKIEDDYFIPSYNEMMDKIKNGTDILVKWKDNNYIEEAYSWFSYTEISMGNYSLNFTHYGYRDYISFKSESPTEKMKMFINY